MDLAIVVPVLGRPDNAAPFIQSLLGSLLGAEVDLFVVGDELDYRTITAWETLGVPVNRSEKGTTFPNKVQDAYERTTAEWLLLIGDDVAFHPGWYQSAAIAAAEDDVSLIATNDMHNPFVTAGQHATHPLIRRTWVDELGASWDGPGTIAHQGYHHAYVDAEWTAKAHQDGVFAYAEEVRIEHLHPTWFGGVYDGTYMLGMALYNEDAALFEQRREEHTCESL